MENKRKHLEIIQGVIERLASNLFFVKGWAVTLVVGLFALFAQTSKPDLIFISFVPLFVFWILDGYFLAQERRFRDLYNHVRTLQEDSIDFSLDTSPYQHKWRNNWFASMFSPTLMWFYTPLVITIFVIRSII